MLRMFVIFILRFGYAILNFRKHTIDTNKKKMRKEIGERGDDRSTL